MAKKSKIKRAADWTRRVHPKLRMMLNGDPSVNAYRAENTGAIFMKTKKLARETPSVASVVTPAEAIKVKKLPKLNRKKRQRAQVMVNVFVETTEAVNFRNKRAEYGNFTVVLMPLDRVETLVKDHPKVAFVEQAENLKEPAAIPIATGTTAPSKAVGEEKLHRHGKGVLIGIIDVEGFDWLHPDFQDSDGNTRFIQIWDQGRESKKPLDPKASKITYGTEITQDMMKKAVSQAPKAGVSPHDLEPQSQMRPGSHGTHVASIAAGNSGVCSKADIAAVLISLPDMDRRTSFYDATNLLDAINYLLDLAKRRKQQRVSINVSLGTNGHAHDGSSMLDRWIDALIAEPGRSICVAAGNAGQERADKPGDLGYILGRIHTSGRIASKGLNHDIEWVVAGDNRIDVSENELEFWYEPQDQIAVSVMPPGSNSWIGPINPGEFIENLLLPNKTVLSIYNERYHPANGSNYIAIYLAPLTQSSQVVGITAGIWKVRLHGIEIRNGNFHGWIERDDPASVGDGRYYWPSYFTEQSNVDQSSVSSLACGDRIVSVANLDEARQRINISSSQGPTRDGRFKPDVAAAGTNVWAANGFDDPKRPWLSMTGTSMASPYVAGVIGLMLAAQPNLTAAQINGILKATARPLPGGTYEWVNDSGFGVIDPVACIKEARTVEVRQGVKDKFK